MPRVVKVAVIGSGLAGLTASYLLSNQLKDGSGVIFEVHLFEKEAILGMDASSISLPVGSEDGEWRVDVPMRSFQGGYYPQLISLYNHLGVAFRQADFSYSFSILNHARRQITTTMIYNGASGRAGVGMPSALNDTHIRLKEFGFVLRTTAKISAILRFLLLTLLLAFNFLRLICMALPFTRTPRVSQMSFREWVDCSVPDSYVSKLLGLDKSWSAFTSDILIPLFSAVCTASEDDVLNHPMEEFLDYIWLTLGTHHYVVNNGVQDVVARLVHSVPYVHLNSTITRIEVRSDLASIHCNSALGRKVHHGFGHVILATQANRAVPLLATLLSSLPSDSAQRKPVEDQLRCLQTFLYRQTVVINHTDDSLMPTNHSDRRLLNLICADKTEAMKSPSIYKTIKTPSYCVPPTCTMCTHVLSLPPQCPPDCPPVYQTTNPIIPPQEESILSVAHLERAVLTLEAKHALKGLYTASYKRWWQSPCLASSKIGPLQGAGRLSDGGEPSLGVGIWLCGSYAYAGIPLLEGCVASARNVVEQGVLASEGLTITSSLW